MSTCFQFQCQFYGPRNESPESPGAPGRRRLGKQTLLSKSRWRNDRYHAGTYAGRTPSDKIPACSTTDGDSPDHRRGACGRFQRRSLPLPRGGWCSFSPDQKQLAYNRVFREFRTWKRYRGGQADDIWIYDFETKSTRQVTHFSDFDKDEVKKVTVKVDAEGLQQRVAVLPVPASGYNHLTSVGDKLYYVRKEKLFFYDLEKEKETELGDFGTYRVSANQKKMLLSRGGSFFIIDLPTSKIETKETLDLSELKVRLDRRAVWDQIYRECWRQMRDFVYDPNLHGVDWQGIRQLYEPLLAHVQHRADLTYIIGEMIGELNLGHCYVGGGEVLPGQNWDQGLRSPLTEIGVNVKAGDFIVAVDGKPTDQMTDIYAALVGKAGKQVTLRVSSAPKTEGAHDEVVVPTGDEQDYPQLYKEALIVDVRGNGGGKVSPQILERLRREPAFWTIARNGAVGVDPSGMVLGPKVLLLDQFSASDGDIVAYRFKKYKLGPVIGLRSWGGVVGIRGSLPLLDGGYLNRPEFSRFDLEAREWIMEGKGVEPDIVVDNDPAHEYAGIDDQLNRAIDEIKSALARNPVRIPQPPPYPDKRQ